MALIKCSECAGPVSSAAKACPSCGHPLPKKPPSARWLLWPFGVLCAIILASLVGPWLGLELTQDEKDANAAFASCKALVETRAFKDKTLKDCDNIAAEVLHKGSSAPK